MIGISGKIPCMRSQPWRLQPVEESMLNNHETSGSIRDVQCQNVTIKTHQKSIHIQSACTMEGLKTDYAKCHSSFPLVKWHRHHNPPFCYPPLVVVWCSSMSFVDQFLWNSSGSPTSVSAYFSLSEGNDYNFIQIQWAWKSPAATSNINFRV